MLGIVAYSAREKQLLCLGAVYRLASCTTSENRPVTCRWSRLVSLNWSAPECQREAARRDASLAGYKHAGSHRTSGQGLRVDKIAVHRRAVTTRDRDQAGMPTDSRARPTLVGDKSFPFCVVARWSIPADLEGWQIFSAPFAVRPLCSGWVPTVSGWRTSSYPPVLGELMAPDAEYILSWEDVVGSTSGELTDASAGSPLR